MAIPESRGERGPERRKMALHWKPFSRNFRFAFSKNAALSSHIRAGSTDPEAPCTAQGFHGAGVNDAA